MQFQQALYTALMLSLFPSQSQAESNLHVLAIVAVGGNTIDGCFEALKQHTPLYIRTNSKEKRSYAPPGRISSG